MRSCSVLARFLKKLRFFDSLVILKLWLFVSLRLLWRSHSTQIFGILIIDWLNRTVTTFRDLSGKCKLRILLAMAYSRGFIFCPKKEKLGVVCWWIFDPK
ncbi:MAG: hypothetical protein US31_C0014G0028 [Berkelbacteria bacterium GW2011_GWA1_36_9]|uniref:Uncharacterized protein n=1 Tax=Berkelbacteria bacterium GW2011_GWA1_36_9 TaxID=1618331 RepID=A0A0G0FJ98_9BACT|nr:MAG: hypothetical protein US31_C0014G0028 [Berkelbacteria bacterium GW2011_GWA1_36_9]